MKGTLAKMIPDANKYTTIFKSHSKFKNSTISLWVINPNSLPATIDVHITSLNVLSSTEIIAKSKIIKGQSGVFRLNDITVSPGERVLIRSDKPDTIFRVFGSGVSETLYTDNHKLLPPIVGVAHEIYGVLASADALQVYKQAWKKGGPLLEAKAAIPLPDTGYPNIVSVTQISFATLTTDHFVTMPPVTIAGQGILVTVTNDTDASITTPSDWDRLYTEANGTALRGSAYTLIADGTEGGTTVNFITSVAIKCSFQVFLIDNWNGSLAGFHNGIATEITTGTTLNPPSVIPYWGTGKNLYLAVMHTSTSQTAASAPAGYTDLLQTSTGNTTSDAQCITARKFAETNNETPGVFTMSGSGASKVCNLIAIAPAYVGNKYEHFNITKASTTLWVGLYTSQPYQVPDPGIKRAVIVLHGKSLDASEYSNVVRKNLENYLGNVIVLAPFFERSVLRAEVGQVYWGSSWPELGRSSTNLAWRVSSGEVLDMMIDQLFTTFVNLEGVIICGHSAGGQLTHRYSSAKQDDRIRYLVSAPSSYAYPGPERFDAITGYSIPTSSPTYNDWKYGYNNLSPYSYVDAIGAANLLDRLRKSKVHYMVGANDNDPADTSLDVSPDGLIQGPNRLERQQRFYDYLKYLG